MWIEQAKFDLQAARISYENGFYEWTTFQSVQAVEKALKSVIVYSGWRPPKLHRLSVLIGLANQVNPEFERIKFLFNDLESFTFISRYPFALPGNYATPHDSISKGDADKAYNQAVDIVGKIGSLLEVSVVPEHSFEIVEQSLTLEEIDERIRQIVGVIKREFDPDKIVLFGSFAEKNKKNSRPFNTMDIMVIAKTDLPFFERIKKVREVTKGGIPTIEPLVYTPEEFQSLKDEEGEGLLEEAIEKGRVLYERHNNEF